MPNNNMPRNMYDVVIIGAGCAGLGAAMYAGRLNMKTLIIADNIGGTITLTDVVENYPGFIRLTGQELADNLRKHAEDYKIEKEEAKVTKIRKEHGCFFVETNEKKVHESKTIIFATGTEWRKLNIPGEKEFASKGVHYCALCDGAIYQNRVVAVVGGGDSAAKEALLLSQYASKVYVIVRGDKLRGEPINNDRVAKNPKIEVVTNVNVREIAGDKVVKGIKLDKPVNGNTTLNLDAVFAAIGHIALSQLAKDAGVSTNEKGEVMIDRESKTNVPGFFAAGDVCDTHFKQAITGVSEGVTAVYSAYTYINENEFICPVGNEDLMVKVENKKKK
ncbi:FAD-dependent oxidoreductase [Candidatus Woesearchaeota archaeon]|nr:FAD-dependent oxidoreductase [Candidatus Woesearchaeota archaeon]